jgi:hypothetical protein
MKLKAAGFARGKVRTRQGGGGMTGRVRAVVARGRRLGGDSIAGTHLKETSATKRYLPEYDINGDLLLPEKLLRRVFVGFPLTPDALDGKQANLPAFHNVDIKSGS